MLRTFRAWRCLLLSFAVVFFSVMPGLNSVQAAAQGNEKLPDLVVADLELGDGNEVIVTIKNTSMIGLPVGWSGYFSVSINNGQGKMFDLTKPYKTINGGIPVGGGSSVFLTGLVIAGKATVFCFVDPTQAIEESNESNNSLEKVLVEITPSPTSTPSPTPSPLPSVKPSPTPTISPKPSPTPTTAPPPSPSPSPTPSSPPAPTDFSPNPAGKLLNILSGPTADKITAHSTVITWSTSLLSDSEVIYGTNPFQLSDIVSASNLMKEHQIELKGLSADTVYAYFVQSTTPTGRTIRSLLHYFSTPPADEKELPAFKLDLADEIAGRPVRFATDIPSESSVERVVFFIDGQPFMTDYSWPFIWEFDTTRFADGTHSFGTDAFNASGDHYQTARDSVIRNRLPAELSPVSIRIISPDDRENVSGIVNVNAEVEHDLGLRIDLIEFQADGAVFQTQSFSPAIALESILAPFFVAVGRWDASAVSSGEHIINVRVRDEAGNWGLASRRAIVVAPPEPDISITREVRRIGSCYEVTLHLVNNSDIDVRDIVLADISRGFQYLDKIQIWHDRVGEAGAVVREGRVSRTGDSHAMTRIEFQFGTLAAGEAKSVRTKVVPILNDPFDPRPNPVIGTELTLVYATAAHNYKEIVAVPHGLSFAEFAEATHASDYLIMTCPDNLDQYNSVQDTDRLLVKMAELAVARQGVFGYLSPLRRTIGANFIKSLIEQDCVWNTQMSPDWNEQGYLLIVGESEIVPTYYWMGVPLTDYPFASTTGDGLPELRVGRIVGDTAAELIMPIENSLQGVYNARQVLVVSGPEDTWEKNIMNSEIGLRTLAGLGLDGELIHTEFWTTQRAMLAEGIRIKKTPQDQVKLKDLAMFLLRRIGLPDGASPEQDLPGYSVNQLAAWLYKAVVGLGSLSLEEVLADADVIITAKGNGQGLNGVMWRNLQEIIGENGQSYEFSLTELAAWLLWEETTPRGPLMAAELGEADLGDTRRQLAELTLDEWIVWSDRIITPFLTDLAIGRAQSIQAGSTTRGGYYPPWNYRYYRTINEVLQERSQAVKLAAARGVDLIIFYGHGNPGSWAGVLDDYSMSDCTISGITFGRRNPVVAAFSCLTGYYDDVAGESDPAAYSISEGFLQNGAAVYMGATKIMSYGKMDELVKTQFWASWDNTDSAGNILHDLKMRVNLLDSSWYDFLVYYNLYGDPKYGMR